MLWQQIPDTVNVVRRHWNIGQLKRKDRMAEVIEISGVYNNMGGETLPEVSNKEVIRMIRPHITGVL